MSRGASEENLDFEEEDAGVADAAAGEAADAPTQVGHLVGDRVWPARVSGPVGSFF